MVSYENKLQFQGCWEYVKALCIPCRIHSTGKWHVFILVKEVGDWHCKGQEKHYCFMLMVTRKALCNAAR